MRSQRYGVRSRTSWKSSIVSGMSAARAIARKCSTELVDPPSAFTIVIALMNDARERMSRGFRSSSSNLRMYCAAR